MILIGLVMLSGGVYIGFYVGFVAVLPFFLIGGVASFGMGVRSICKAFAAK